MKLPSLPPPTVPCPGSKPTARAVARACAYSASVPWVGSNSGLTGPGCISSMICVLAGRRRCIWGADTIGAFVVRCHCQHLGDALRWHHVDERTGVDHADAQRHVAVGLRHCFDSKDLLSHLVDR